MNKDILKGQWKELKGEVKKKWGKLTDDDLLEIEGKKKNSRGCCKRDMDLPVSKLRRNMRNS